MLRESLTVALEVSSRHLSEQRIHAVERIVSTLRHGTEFDVMELSIDDDTEAALKDCLGQFKQTVTWQWLKGDFRDAVLKLDHFIHHVRGCTL